MRRLTITLAVALFLGFVRPQNETTPSTAATGLGGYAKSFQEYTKKFQEKYLGMGDSMGQEFMTQMNQTAYQLQQDKFTQQALTQGKKFQQQTQAWMSQAGAHDAFADSYSTAYMAPTAAGAESLALYSGSSWEQYDLESDQLENDFYLKERAMKQVLKITEQALKNQLTIEDAAIVADTTLNATLVAEKKAALKVAYDTQIAQLKADFSQKKEDAKFALKLKQEDLKHLEEEARYNETLKFTEPFIATLPNATQTLLKTEQQKEKDALARKKVEKKT